MSAKVLKEAKLILASVSANNNKFWTCRLHDNFDVSVTYGRVGSAGASKSWPTGSAAAAESLFASKCKDKQRSGYQAAKVLSASATPKALFLDTLADLARSQLCPAAPADGSSDSEDGGLVSRLVAHLVKANTHEIVSHTSLAYDEAAGSFSTPLGIVDQDAVAEARGVLARIGGMVAGATPRDGWEPLLEKYLMLIPQDIGMARPTLDRLFPGVAAVREQGAVLDALEASIRAVQAAAAAAAAKPAADGGAGSACASAAAQRVFNARLHLVPAADAAYAAALRLFEDSANAAHRVASRVRLRRLFGVRIDAMADAFDARGRAVGNVQRLWHGTRASNLLSILRAGMVVPPASSPHVTGRMYGDGLYFSDQSTKSLNYSLGAAPGQGSSSRGATGAPSTEWRGSSFMFLCDVAMGRAFTPASSGWGSRSFPVAGYDSTFARGGHSGVRNNEMIVYGSHQANPVYLCEFGEGDGGN